MLLKLLELLGCDKADWFVPSDQLRTGRHGGQDDVPAQTADTAQKKYISLLSMSRQTDNKAVNTLKFNSNSWIIQSGGLLCVQASFHDRRGHNTLALQWLVKDRERHSYPCRKLSLWCCPDKNRDMLESCLNSAVGINMHVTAAITAALENLRETHDEDEALRCGLVT